MKKKSQITHRRYMILFKNECGDVDYLMLNANTYSEAIKIAKCVAGDKAASALCYKDFLVYD